MAQHETLLCRPRECSTNRFIPPAEWKTRPLYVAFVMSLLVLLVASATVISAPRALATASKPATDWSWYVTTSDTSTAQTLGCNQGTFDASYSPHINSIVVLDFGAQNSSGTDTLTTFTGVTLTNSQIEKIAEAFAFGYWDCLKSDTTSFVTLGIGTNDSQGFSTSTYTALGPDWVNIIDAVSSWVYQNSFQNNVTVWGANDIESWDNGQGFYVSNTQATAWVNAYSGVSSPPPYVDYGDAAGCPQTTDQNGSCEDGYHQSDYYYYSWGAPPALGTPEIYYSAQAQQWTEISLYANTLGVKMYYEAPWDEYDLNASTLTATGAWNDLQNDLSGAGMNTYMPYSIEIHCEQSGYC